MTECVCLNVMCLQMWRRDFYWKCYKPCYRTPYSSVMTPVWWSFHVTQQNNIFHPNHDRQCWFCALEKSSALDILMLVKSTPKWSTLPSVFKSWRWIDRRWFFHSNGKSTWEISNVVFSDNFPASKTPASKQSCPLSHGLTHHEVGKEIYQKYLQIFKVKNFLQVP